MNNTPNILLVDDSENDLFLMRNAFRKAEFNIPLHEVHNGEEAIAYLKGDGSYSDRKQFPLPTLMLLDLNMPRKNGFDVITWVRAQTFIYCCDERFNAHAGCGASVRLWNEFFSRQTEQYRSVGSDDSLSAGMDED